MNLLEYATGIQHIGIPTQDFSRSMQFYLDLGMRLDWRTSAEQQNQVAFFSDGSLVIELYQATQTAMHSGAVDHIAIDILDVDAAYRLAQAQGYTLLDDHIQSLPLLEGGVRFFMIEGPNREKIEFCQTMK